MNFLTKGLAAGALAMSLTVAATPANAVTFASFSQKGDAKTVNWTRSADGLGGSLFTTENGTSAGSILTSFNFLVPQLAELSGLDATFTLLGTVTNTKAVQGVDPITGQTVVSQANLDGEGGQKGFKFIYAGPTFTTNSGLLVSTGANLLSGTFTKAYIAGAKATNSGAFPGSDTLGTVSFTSSFMDFTGASEKGFSFGLTSISPTLSYQANKALPSFKSSVTGSFSAALVPEPGTWMLLIGGFAVAGAFLRRERRRQGPAFA